MTHVVGMRLRNWMRYRGEFELALEPGCYAVVAEHELDARRSNYLGKSSFLAAFRWALEGIHVEAVDTLDELISWGEDVVGVDLELDDGTFISREKERKKSMTLVVENPHRGPTGVELRGDPAQAEIERVLGISAADRLTTCWSEQGELPLLVKPGTTSGKLTKMVERWLGAELERLVEAGKIVADRFSSRSGEHAAAVAELHELEERANPAKIEELEQEVKELEAEHATRLKQAEQVREARERHADRRILSEKITKCDELRTTIKAGAKAYEGEEPEGAVIDVEATEKQKTDAQREVSNADAERTRLRKEQKRLQLIADGEFDGACPVSAGFVCPAKDTINQRSAPNREALRAAERTLEKANDTYAAHELVLKQLHGKLAQHRTDEQRRQQKQRHDDREAERLRLVQVELDKLEAEVAEAKAAGTIPLKRGEEPPDYVAAPDLGELEQVRGELADRRNAAGLLHEARLHVESTALKGRAHRLAAGVLGPEGARRRVTERVVTRIELDANRLLHEAGIGLTVKAAWARETSVLADQCPECGCAYPASAKVKRCERCGAPRGHKMSHEFRWRLSNTSGAARDLAGLALRAAGFSWLRGARGASWSVAAFDEVTGQLDRAHRASVSASIRRLLVGTFSQAFLTAHEPGVLATCDKQILIAGSGDWSTIKVT